MKILLATHNPSKFLRYQKLLSQIPNLELVSLDNLSINKKVEERFNTAKENAIHKAKQYAEISNLITISIDEATHTNFLPDDEQPGVYVRRFKKDRSDATDKESISYWKEILSRFPQEDKKFNWDFFIAYYNPKNKSLDTSLVTMETKVSKTISKVVEPGYPMSSFLIYPGTNQPISEISDEKEDKIYQNVFVQFMQEFKTWLSHQ